MKLLELSFSAIDKGVGAENTIGTLDDLSVELHISFELADLRARLSLGISACPEICCKKQSFQESVWTSFVAV
jgi:hypothetical protein